MSMDLGRLRAEGRRNLSESEVKDLLESRGIRVTNRTVIRDDLGEVDLRYPLVMKVDSPDILHKTDVGGVVLNILDREALETEFERMRAKFPNERIMVEEMEEGEFEVIVGLLNDRDFGLCIMFGVGGVLTELYKDVAFRKVPISREDGREMMSSIKASALFKGFRGIEADAEGMLDLLLRISDIGKEHGEHIDQLDLNPVMVRAEGNVTVDAKLVLRPS
jgi:acyl-CoA synthetase (NDP forming)